VRLKGSRKIKTEDFYPQITQISADYDFSLRGFGRRKR
jgi:hypothetical protein